MKYYTIAKKVSQTYGHGDFGEEYHICPIDSYHTNSMEFHPLFPTRELAQKYLESLKWNYNKIIVELNVYHEP